MYRNEGEEKLTQSGFVFEGSWTEICQIAEYLKELFEAKDVSEKDLNDYDDWKPKPKESSEDMDKKTAKIASLNKKKFEREYEGNKKKIKNLVQGFSTTETEYDMSDKFRDLFQVVGEIIGANSLQFFRSFEEIIYESIMLKFNPKYFDTEELSINLRDKDNNRYVFTVNVLDEDLRKFIKKRFSDSLNV